MAGERPGRGPPVDRAAVEKLRRILPYAAAGRRGATVAEVPQEVAFKLTNRCDLRCAHCYQWNEAGHHRHLAAADAGADLDLALVADVLAATSSARSNVYLWGGEPLLYRHWDGLLALLEAEGRWTTICTNGTRLVERLASLRSISARTELSISVDGFEHEHDALRGRGAYRRTARGLAAVMEARRDGSYRGEVTVNCVVTGPMVHRLFEFVAHVEGLGVDAVYLSLPWFLPDATAARMDAYVSAHLPWIAPPARGSWWSYRHHLDPQWVDALAAELERVDAARWRTKVRHNPPLGPAELRGFLAGGEAPPPARTCCLAVGSRLDVMPNGDVVSCKFYPELRVGNLRHEGPDAVWHGARFTELRDVLRHRGLMPACVACSLLYSRGA